MNRPDILLNHDEASPRRGRWPLALAATLVGTAALLLSFGAAAQKINDVPMAVKNNVAPNFMFMVDNSGSMSNLVPTAPYDEAVDYTPTSNCSGSQILADKDFKENSLDLRIATAGTNPTRGRRSFIYTGSSYRHSTQTDTNAFGSNSYRCFARNGVYKARLLADNTGNTGPGNYLGADYTGNYLNWYFSTRCSGTLAWSGDRKPLGSCAGALETRMEIAKQSGKTLVDALPKPASTTADAVVRVGLSTYNNGDGGTLIEAIRNLSANDSDDSSALIGRTRLKAAIQALDPSGNTPLAETLSDIGRYLATGPNLQIALPDTDKTKVAANTFFKQDGSSTNSCLSGAACGAADPQPIQQWCQRSYVFLLTDGRPQGDQAFTQNTFLRDYDKDCTAPLGANCDRSAGFDQKTDRGYESAGSDYLDDVAMALFDIDLRPDLLDPRPPPADPLVKREPKKNNARTYVIGFADTQVKDDPLLINTAKQGGGKFITAADGPQLTKALLELMTDAFAQDAASAAVSVANPQISNNDTSYAPSYFSGAWYGDVQAFKIDKATGKQLKPAIWSAQALLDGRSHIAADSNGRKIATFSGTGGVRFEFGQFTAPSALTADVIKYLRGDRSLEKTTLRPRNHLLGDIINAEPVVMNYPGATSSDSAVPIVFQAANDGMLHVIDGRTTGSTAGQELWAYVPRAVHGKLAALSVAPYEHQYYVDATPAVASVTGQGAMTRLLVGGLGKGGGAYFGLDISSYAAATEDAAANKVKWEFTHANLGYSFGTPLIVKTSVGWRVVVSSGYGNGTGGPNGNGTGRGYVWVLNPSTGAVLATYDTEVGTASSPAGLAHLAKPANTTADAEVRYVYGGDLLGNVWRFDITDPTIKPVKIAGLTARDGTVQPITAPVEVGPVSGSTTKHFVYVGTGRYLSDDDVPGSATAALDATQRQSMYGLIDDTSVGSPTALTSYRNNPASVCPANGGDGALTCQQLSYNSTSGRFGASTAVMSATSRGWYLDLPTDTLPASGSTPANPLMNHGRVTGKPAITTGGTLAFTVNVPTSTKCDPGGSSWFLQLSGQNGGAIPREAGGNTYYDAGFFLGNALASRVVVIEVSEGEDGNKVALIQMSDREVKNMPINETKNPPVPGGGTATWRRIYWRQLK